MKKVIYFSTKKIRHTICMFLVMIIIVVAYNFAFKQYVFKSQNENENALKMAEKLSDKDNPYYIYVDLDDCKLYLYKNGGLFRKYSCSGGKESTPSPLGTWTIISKDTWGEGFGGRWMGINVPWGRYGIHGTIFPNTIGWNASHGCVRMFNKDVAKLYSIVPHGTKVTIVKGPYGNFGYGLRIMKHGDRGSDVYEIEERLSKLGYFKGYIDGVFGSELEASVHKFRKDNKLYGRNIVDMAMYKKMGIELMD